MLQPNKIQAIYSLRDAAEHKAVAEQTLRTEPSARHRDELLDAQMALEAKTQDAIEACHECGAQHRADQPHAGGSENVIDIDFRQNEGR